MSILLGNSKKEKKAAIALQQAMISGDDTAIQNAWSGFHDSIAEVVQQKVEDSSILMNATTMGDLSNNKPFMKVKDFKNETIFRQSFTGSSSRDMSIGDFGKGLLLNEWGEHKQQANKVDGSVLLPVSIMSDIIYSASQHSVLLGNCPVIPMEEATVLIGKVKEDVELDFKEKFKRGKETTLGLEGVSLEAKTLYAYVEIAEEDLQDIKNLDNILRNAFSRAIAKSLDENFLYTNLNADSNKGVYPKGILDNPNIKNIIVSSTDYDMIASANLEIAKANGKTNTVGFNPIECFKLQTMKDSIGQYINPPSFYNDLTKIESNGLKPNDVIVFDSEQILIGIRKAMDIKVMPSLETGTVIMRCMLRADVAPTREEHICKIKIEESKAKK